MFFSNEGNGSHESDEADEGYENHGSHETDEGDEGYESHSMPAMKPMKVMTAMRQYKKENRRGYFINAFPLFMFVDIQHSGKLRKLKRDLGYIGAR